MASGFQLCNIQSTYSISFDLRLGYDFCFFSDTHAQRDRIYIFFVYNRIERVFFRLLYSENEVREKEREEKKNLYSKQLYRQYTRLL